LQPTAVVTSATTPTAVTSPATGVRATSATLMGVANPNGVPASAHFDWGLTTGYGQRSPATDSVLRAGETDQAVSQPLTGLTPGTVYHYRLVVTDCGGCQSGTSYGADMIFTTTSSTSPTIGAPGSAAPAAPTPHRTALTSVLSGTARVKVPGSSILRPLTVDQDIPIGSVIDASHARLRITTALNARGRTQSATVWGGTFALKQAKGRGMITFKLPGLPSCSAATSFTAMRAAHSSRKPPKKQAKRSLWAHDNHGQYTTRGNNSVATVRGTWWETVESCRGTLTYVKKGLVSVRDLRRHRTVLVAAGHSYLARP
jgi:hypothetical protein